MDLDNLKDRGTKKWTSMFLPEHVAMVKQMWIDDHRIQMPMLDDYQVQEFEERIHYAREYKLPVEFLTYDNGFTETIIGRVHSFDQIKLQIKVILDDGTTDYILFSEIINVTLKD